MKNKKPSEFLENIGLALLIGAAFFSLSFCMAAGTYFAIYLFG